MYYVRMRETCEQKNKTNRHVTKINKKNIPHRTLKWLRDVLKTIII